MSIRMGLAHRAAVWNGAMRAVVLAGAACSLAGCATALGNQMLAVGGTGLVGVTPTSNIGQTYYLGVFDPREQLPPTIYRLRVHGQASALSRTSFASGWVRADLMDSLSGRAEIEKEKGIVTVSNSDQSVVLADDKSGLNRRLIMFGPEGFREAPKNHRLVVVMGSSPETFFGSIDRALGIVSSATTASEAAPDMGALWSEMSHLREERRGLQTLLDLAARDKGQQ